METALRVLALDGGGAKGFYTLGVLSEVEAALGGCLSDHFGLIYGTSTGSIIGSLLGLGRSVQEIHDLYISHVPNLMRRRTRSARTAELRKLAYDVFEDASFADMKTCVGIVAARWLTEKPMIFKTLATQAHGAKASFVPGFGVPVAEAVRASCSAFPFFDRAIVRTAHGEQVELIDGGYCANNPTLYAIADATGPMGYPLERIKVLSVGVGIYPPKRRFLLSVAKSIPFNSIDLLQKTLEINTQSMDQLRSILFNQVQTTRVSDTYAEPHMATDLLEHDTKKLNQIWQRGRESFAKHEHEILDLLR